jgi:hypothetical protein
MPGRIYFNTLRNTKRLLNFQTPNSKLQTGGVFLFAVGCLLFVASSCQYLKEKITKQDEPVARAFDKYLYPTDLKGLVPPGTSAKDSVDIINGYIENWVRQAVILKQAEENINYDKADIEKQLENYRNSLIIFSYEQQLVGQKLDTTVTNKEIEDYYHQNRNNFELKKSILKASYIKLPGNAHNVDAAKKWFLSSKEKDKEALETYCMQFASIYSLTDTSWFYLDLLMNIIPLDNFNESSILQKNNYIEFEQDGFVYLVRVKDYMYKDDISPLEFEVENIRNIIINKRKLKLINDMENSVYKEALNKSDIEIYEKKD